MASRKAGTRSKIRSPLLRPEMLGSGARTTILRIGEFPLPAMAAKFPRHLAVLASRRCKHATWKGYEYLLRTGLHYYRSNPHLRIPSPRARVIRKHNVWINYRLIILADSSTVIPPTFPLWRRKQSWSSLYSLRRKPRRVRQHPRLTQVKSRDGNIGNNEHLLGMKEGYPVVDSS
jgi:hypothetical protein